MSFANVEVGSYCFMDYETTGVDTSCQTNVTPIQIGCVFASPKMEKIVEYSRFIKNDKIMKYDKWPVKWHRAFQIHKIPLEQVKDSGIWPYQVRQDLIEITDEVQDTLDTKKLSTIISDAPNFEMFFTEMIFGSKNDDVWPFRKNAWSVYPLFQIMGIETLYGRKPHDALADARLLYEGMSMCYEKSKEI